MNEILQGVYIVLSIICYITHGIVGLNEEKNSFHYLGIAIYCLLLAILLRI